MATFLRVTRMYGNISHINMDMVLEFQKNEEGDSDHNTKLFMQDGEVIKIKEHESYVIDALAIGGHTVHG